VFAWLALHISTPRTRRALGHTRHIAAAADCWLVTVYPRPEVIVGVAGLAPHPQFLSVLMGESRWGR
jgi:hypothetical protein